MKRFTSTRLFAIVCMIVMGFVQTWAQDNATITVNAPNINPGSCNYNGTITPTITADDGCSIVYNKSTTQIYATVEELDAAKGNKTAKSNQVTITDIVGKTGNRYISAYATKEVNGVTYKSDVTYVTYTYDKNATSKTDITLSASSIKLDMSKPTETANLNVVAKDANSNIINNLTYSFTVTPEGIVTVANDGTVTPVKAGTASINVIFEGNDSYNSASCVADVNVSSSSTRDDKVFHSIADMRHATQPESDAVWNDDTRNTVIKNTGCALIFDESNPATVIAVMKNSDGKIDDKKFINSFFIIDNSNRGLWIVNNSFINPTKDDLKIGTKITGTLLGTYAEGEKGIPSLTEIKDKIKINEINYTMQYQLDHTGEGTDEVPATYPYTEVTDVNTLATSNHKYGSIRLSSYGVYLNSIVSVPGTIKKGSDNVYYLMQNESYSTVSDNDNFRLSINTSQIGVDLADYVNTSGTFEGILVKLSDNKAKLVVLKNNFFDIEKIYLDENDDEKRIDDLVNAGAFDGEVDVYIHRTKLVNTNAWNTLCFPFNLTADEFYTAFGCELTALAAPKVNSEETETTTNRLTKIGEVDSNNNLLFNTVSDLAIEAGMPYLMKASGTQTACANNNIKYKKDDGSIKTPQELMADDKNYYAYIGQKMITVVPPHQIRGNIDNKVVGGNFYFRGLYGGKDYTENEDGTLTNIRIGTDDSQKYQYISTGAGNYLRYLTASAKSTARFSGFRAYLYFPGWNAEENNKIQGVNNTNNAKVFLFVEDSTTGISDIRTDESHNDGRIYNLAGQVVDESYKGIVIKNGRKYLAK